MDILTYFFQNLIDQVNNLTYKRWSNIIKFNLIDMFRILNISNKGYISLSYIPGKFTKISHVLGYRGNFNKKEISQAIYADQGK